MNHPAIPPSLDIPAIDGRAVRRKEVFSIPPRAQIGI